MNVELAMKALELAKANPEEFDMSSFAGGWWGRDEPAVKDGEDFKPPCGTTACYAGWVSYIAAPVGSKVQGEYVWEPGKRARHVEGYATEALDITSGQAMSLFFLDNIRQVEAALKYLDDNPGATEDALDAVTGVYDDDDEDAE